MARRGRTLGTDGGIFSLAGNRRFPREKRGSQRSPGRFGAVTDPDEAVRTAIKAAVDAGRVELAARLLDVLQEAPKSGGVVRLETLKKAR